MIKEYIKKQTEQVLGKISNYVSRNQDNSDTSEEKKALNYNINNYFSIGDDRFIPKRITGKPYLYVALGIKDYKILDDTDLDYIIIENDGIDINHLIPKNVIIVLIETNYKKDI